VAEDGGQTKILKSPRPTEYVLVHQRTVDDDDDGTAENGHVIDAASEQRGRFDDTHGEAGDLVSTRATADQENLENLENPASRHGAATAAHCEGDAAAYRRAC